MGISTSLFMCGCKVYSKRTSRSTNPLLSNGNASISSHLHSENLHSVEVNSKTNKDKRETRCGLLHCCCWESDPINTVPCCQVMETQDRSQDTVMTNLPSNDLHVGSMRISKPQFKALLVFSKDDSQCQAWQAALDRIGFHYDVETNEENVSEKFRKNQPHLVVIENKHKVIDAESLCRSLRGTYIGTFTTIVAVMGRRYKSSDTSTVKLPCFLSCDFYKRNQVDETLSTRDLLHSGFDRLFVETTNLEEIENELLQLETGLLTLQLKFRSCQAVFTALDKSRDIIQITDGNYKIQYVNKMYERVTGFASKQVVGNDLSEYFDHEKNEEGTWERMRDELSGGKEYDGYFYTKQKLGEGNQFYVLILPLTGQDDSVLQYVVVSRLHGNNSIIPDLSLLLKRKNSYDYHRKHSGAAEQLQLRRLSAASLYAEGDSTHRRTNSLAKIHSMAIEAPITQIINLISIIKDSSQPSVSDVLDQILDILRNSELYSPADLPNRTRDPMLSDFVEGLVTGTGGFGHRRASGGTGENLLGRTPPSGGMKAPPLPGSHLASVLDANPQIAMCLENLDSWDYDVLALERVTAKKPLVHLGMRILNQFNTCEVLSCSPTTLQSWLAAIEANYHSSNPYHNSTHAADVLHATAYFLKKERVKTWMEPLDEVSSLLAAIIHDVDHPGKTNAFLVNSNNPLALLYNDTAVLESHHAAFAFKFTVNSDNCNIFKNMSNDNFRNIRQSIIDMVLATELSKHFEHVNKFISIVTKNNNINSPLEQEGAASPSNRISGVPNPAITHELKTLIKRVMIKVADVINPARKTQLCVEWARRISEEYFTQTDEEKRLGLPVVMPHFDRNNCSMPKSQITFIDYFLTDMFEAWHEFCGMDDAMTNLSENYLYWQKLQDRGIMRLAELEDESFSDEEDDDDENSKVEARLSKLTNEETVKSSEKETIQLENHLS